MSVKIHIYDICAHTPLLRINSQFLLGDKSLEILKNNSQFANHHVYNLPITHIPNKIIPSNSVIRIFLEFEKDKDAGIDYRLELPSTYDTIKYGKPFELENKTFTEEDFEKNLDSDKWQEYANFPKNIKAFVGVPGKTNFTLEIGIEKILPNGAEKNMTTCNLYIYQLEYLKLHVNLPTYERIKSSKIQLDLATHRTNLQMKDISVKSEDISVKSEDIDIGNLKIDDAEESEKE